MRRQRSTICAALIVSLAASWAPQVEAQAPQHGSHGQPTSTGETTPPVNEGDESVPPGEDDQSHGEEAAPPTEVPITSRIVWQGFGDVGWQRSDDPDRANTFTLGQLTLYPTATLSDRLSVLAEIVFKAGRYNQLTVELERVLVRYAFAESLA